MKKTLLLSLCISFIFVLIVGCGNKEISIIHGISKKKLNLDKYFLNGTLEILNNDESYLYEVKVAYKKNNYFRVDLENKKNNYKQIILRNSEGVYVLTPSLNKCFKFQSEWPYSNSQIYLLSSIYNDILNDKKRIFKSVDNNYEFTNKIFYPNNKTLKVQKVIIDSKFNIKSVKVYNNENLMCMKMNFNNIDYSPNLKKDYFNLKNIDNLDNKEVIKKNTLDEVLYPLNIPEGTSLLNEEIITNGNLKKVILSFGGEKSFTLVEEPTSIYDDFTIIPTYGDVLYLNDSYGISNKNSLSWTSNGIDYFLISDVIKKTELIEIAKSIYPLQNNYIK